MRRLHVSQDLFHVLRLKPLENHRDRQARLAAYLSELVCVLFPIQEILFRACSELIYLIKSRCPESTHPS